TSHHAALRLGRCKERRQENPDHDTATHDWSHVFIPREGVHTSAFAEYTVRECPAGRGSHFKNASMLPVSRAKAFRLRSRDQVQSPEMRIPAVSTRNTLTVRIAAGKSSKTG